LLFEP
jgi:integrase